MSRLIYASKHIKLIYNFNISMEQSVIELNAISMKTHWKSTHATNLSIGGYAGSEIVLSYV